MRALTKLFRAAAILIALAFAGSATAADAPKADGVTARAMINFSILSAEDQQSMSTYWQPLLDDMQAQTGLTIKAFYSSNYTTLIQAMAFNQTQVGWFSAEPAVEAIKRAHGEVVARTIDDHGKGTYNSVILAKKGSGLTLDALLKCDHSLSFGLGDPTSTSGTLAPMVYLFGPRHIDPNTCFKQVRSASHQNNMLSVANGLVDAATNNSVGLAYYRSGAPAVQAAVGRTQVIWTSPDLPESAIVFRKDLPQDVKDKLRAFFTTYGTGPGPEGDRQRAILAKLKYSAFQAADDSYLAPIVHMQEVVAASHKSLSGQSPSILARWRTYVGEVGSGRSWQTWAFLALIAAVLVALLSPRDTANPVAVKPASRAVSVLIWGGVVFLLIISFGSVEMWKVAYLFTKSANTRTLLESYLHPDFTLWQDYVAAMWLTVQIALWGTFLAIVMAIPLGLLASRNVAPPFIQQPVRRLLDVLRAIPDLVVATLFLVAVGLGPLAGVIALAINTGGVLAKLFSEAVESIDPQPVEGVRAVGGSRLHEVVWGVFPQVAPLWTSYALYRFESNARSATVLGLIGAGGIGQLLFDSLNAFKYGQTAVIVIVIVVAVSLIDLLSQALRSRLM
jgi:phosphonate ABC transporter permease subunit PhnE